MKDMFENYKKFQLGGKRQAHFSKTNFNWDAMADLLEDYLNKYLPKFSEEVKLKLPTIDNIKLPKKPTNG